jgi:carbamoyl-phosphate synthase large subunit
LQIKKADEKRKEGSKKIMILGGGPNRIGQGIEFDYCCVHAALALREDGYETIMVNCNPETVSTDYDTSDRLFFEPVTLEDVLEIVRLEKPKGVIVQFGGQTPLKLARALEAEGVPIIGTTPDAIDRAEDRERFQKMIKKLGLLQPHNATARSADEAVELAKEIGYPLVVRPSYVLGGRAMEIVYDLDSLKLYMQQAVTASEQHPVLLDRFLEDAYEFDVDAICDGQDSEICGIMQHIEEAGVHSGDSMAVLPPFLLSRDQNEDIREYTRLLARSLKVKGLINIQFAIMFDTLYVLEVNPRASRTVPFVSKTTGVPIAKLATEIMAGKRLDQLDYRFKDQLPYVAVKESVFPFDRFGKTDIFLRPEMRSTGEVMGIGPKFGEAVFKAFQAAGITIPKSGTVFLSVNDNDKARVLPIAEGLKKFGYQLVATKGTAEYISNRGIPVKTVLKIREGRPNVADDIKNGQIDLIINTPLGQRSRADEYTIGWTAIINKVPFITTLSAAEAIVRGLKAKNNQSARYKCLQDYYRS